MVDMHPIVAEDTEADTAFKARVDSALNCSYSLLLLMLYGSNHFTALIVQDDFCGEKTG